MSSLADHMKNLFRPFDVSQNPEKYRTHEIDSKFQLACVLVPLFLKDGKWFVLLTQRAKHLSRQPSTVAFPGGVREGDETLVDTALREAEEEIGLPRSSVTVIAKLVPLIVRPMSLVSTIVGIIPADFTPVLDKQEVDFVFMLPLQRFLSMEGRTDEVHQFGDSLSLHIYHFKDSVHGRDVDTWGFTATICMQVALVVFQSDQRIPFANNILTSKDTCFGVEATRLLANFLLNEAPSSKL